MLNHLVGEKVSITSPTPNTTRQAIRGIVTDDDTQIIFVDTPGLHRPKTSLGGRLNSTARAAADDVDVVVAMIDAGAAIGPGDRMVLGAMLDVCRRGGPVPLVLVNKVDRSSNAVIAAQLMAAVTATEKIAADSNAAHVLASVEYFPISAKTGEGVDGFVAAVRGAMPESPFLFPTDEISDVPEMHFIAELVREQLVRRTREELPHSIHCRVALYEWPHITVEILVERESQKGMVIGHGGSLLKDVGIAARRQLPEGCFLELRVRVEPSWQKRDDILDRLGY